MKITVLYLCAFVCAGEQAAAVAAATKQLLSSVDHATTSEKDVRKAVMRETGLPKSKALKSLVKSLVDEYFSADEGKTETHISGGGHAPTQFLLGWF
jgi:hypothetical protein